MRHTKYNTRNTSCRLRATSNGCGFTIVELLLALAISSMLLAAVATAFNASIINYRENEDMFKVINSVRQALYRITSQLRTGYWVDPNAPNNECSFLTADDENITYQYNNGDNKLYLITNDDLSDPDYVLCDNVTAMTFTKTPTDDGTDCKSVQISITVARGNVQRKISTAVVIRRNLSW
ncbi:MAG: prepilin-type N-terminal cleavage/methylation domain-containing protein [Planctomycetes bacterium]|nr:prepilin-type N-terminal cleavage/methylation domain-containing protein [Planctomycetota bacterium]